MLTSGDVALPTVGITKVGVLICFSNSTAGLDKSALRLTQTIEIRWPVQKF